MAILKTEKVIIAGLEREKDNFLKAIQKEGLIHLESLKSLNGGESSKVKELEELEEAIKFLGVYEEKKFLSFQPLLLDKEDLAIKKDFSFELSITKELLSLKENLQQIEEKKKEKSKILEELKELSFLDLTFKDLTSLKDFSLTLFFQDKDSILKAIKESPLKDKPYFIFTRKEKKKTVSLLITAKKDTESFISYLKENKLKVVLLPSVIFTYPENTPSQIVKIIFKEIELINKEEREKKERIKSLTPYKEKLILVYEYLFNSLLREKTKASLLTTEKVFLLEGWVLAKDKEKLVSLLNGFKDIFFIIRKPQEGELPPVKLENKKLIEPFQIIVSMYGAPHPFSLDPTAILAPFFFLFVGICISDAGYGLVLAIISLFLLKRLKLLGMGKNFLKLIFYLGLSTVGAGLLLGSIFGLNFKPLQIINPLEDTFKFLLFCFFLGFIHVLVGIFIKVYLEAKKKNFSGLFTQIFWAILLVDLPLYFIYKKPFLKYLGIGSSLGIVFFSSTHKNILVRLAQGLYELYGISKYLSDVLSYSRLVALGLATGVIAMVVNILASFSFKIPILGIFLGIGILVLGHSFNIFINLLSGLIHSARLQFVEFFSKFFELGGRFFEPFSYKTKYAQIKE